MLIGTFHSDIYPLIVLLLSCLLHPRAKMKSGFHGQRTVGSQRLPFILPGLSHPAAGLFANNVREPNTSSNSDSRGLLQLCPSQPRSPEREPWLRIEKGSLSKFRFISRLHQ